MTTIAFLGLGNMGGPMAANLLAAGFAVRGFDIKMPVGLSCLRRFSRERQLKALGQDNFSRANALQCGCQFVKSDFADA